MEKITLEVEDSVAVITNNNPAKKNAFDDGMDVALFEILSELKGRPDVRAAIWRAEGDAWSAGRDVSVIGHNATELSHHELMSRGHRGILQVFELDIPIIVAFHGWAIGGSFQRALLCDIRIAATGTRFKLPELGFGVLPDTGGISRLYQICGPGVVSDLVLTGRTMDADEAFMHGIVSRVVSRDALDDEAWEIARLGRGSTDCHREDGSAPHPAPDRARRARLDGRGARVPDVHQQVGRLRRVQGGSGRGAATSLHGKLSPPGVRPAVSSS